MDAKSHNLTLQLTPEQVKVFQQRLQEHPLLTLKADNKIKQLEKRINELEAKMEKDQAALLARLGFPPE
jgi:hypothetical protein